MLKWELLMFISVGHIDDNGIWKQISKKGINSDVETMNCFFTHFSFGFI